EALPHVGAVLAVDDVEEPVPRRLDERAEGCAVHGVSVAQPLELGIRLIDRAPECERGQRHELDWIQQGGPPAVVVERLEPPGYGTEHYGYEEPEPLVVGDGEGARRSSDVLENGVGPPG